MFPLCLPLRQLFLIPFHSPLRFLKKKKKKCHTEQARKELRRLKHEARSKQAVSVIWACWQGTKVYTSKSHPREASHPPFNPSHTSICTWRGSWPVFPELFPSIMHANISRTPQHESYLHCFVANCKQKWGRGIRTRRAGSACVVLGGRTRCNLLSLFPLTADGLKLIQTCTLQAESHTAGWHHLCLVLSRKGIDQGYAKLVARFLLVFTED